MTLLDYKQPASVDCLATIIPVNPVMSQQYTQYSTYIHGYKILENLPFWHIDIIIHISKEKEALVVKFHSKKLH